MRPIIGLHLEISEDRRVWNAILKVREYSKMKTVSSIGAACRKFSTRTEHEYRLAARGARSLHFLPSVASYRAIQPLRT